MHQATNQTETEGLVAGNGSRSCAMVKCSCAMAEGMLTFSVSKTEDVDLLRWISV